MDLNMPSVDTIRLAVTLDCNLSCLYCCNKIPQFHEQFKPIALRDIDWHRYQTVCITGGEPLLRRDLISRALSHIPRKKTVVLYTNGLLFNPSDATVLAYMGVNAINVGLHDGNDFGRIIGNVMASVKGTVIKVRFSAQDIYEDSIVTDGFEVKYWHLNDCDRANEDRFYLENV